MVRTDGAARAGSEACGEGRPHGAGMQTKLCRSLACSHSRPARLQSSLAAYGRGTTAMLLPVYFSTSTQPAAAAKFGMSMSATAIASTFIFPSDLAPRSFSLAVREIGRVGGNAAVRWQ